MCASVPAIKVAHDADTFGIGCPDRETNSRYAILLHTVRAKDVVAREGQVANGVEPDSTFRA